MDGDTLFCVCMEARTRVLTEISKIRLHKKEVSGYAHNDANTLLTQIEQILERKLFKDSYDGMKGLTSNISIALN